MNNHVDILDPIKVEITDAGFKYNNFKKIEFKEGSSSLELYVNDKNYSELVSRAVIKLGFREKLDLIKQLTEEVGGLYDIDNPEFKISAIQFNNEENKVYTYWEEAQ